MFSSNTSQVADDKLFVEDCFSTYLYQGNGSTQTITNGIDLAGKGGMVWIKSRSADTANFLFDTSRGVNVEINSNTTDANATLANSLTAFNSNGFSISSATGIGVNAATYASWTFREAPKFFDVVTYTGNGANRTISHNLGVAPGCIIVKRTDAAADWQVYHRSNTNAQYMVLNLGDAKATGTTRWNSTTPTATEFTVGTDTTVNASGGTYVAYLFAHDTTSDGIIQCGSFTLSGSPATVNLGWEPQWVMIKSTSSADNWWMHDNMRGMSMTDSAYLRADVSYGEGNFGVAAVTPTPTGFTVPTAGYAAGTYIYIAIRRGPMKTPTSGTSVFSPLAVNNSNGTINTIGFPYDMQMVRIRSDGPAYFFDRLRGVNSTTSAAVTTPYLQSTTTGAEATLADFTRAVSNTGFTTTSQLAGVSNIYWNFSRAPSFFDVVCYTGTGSALTLNHNLSVAPELIIVKKRSGAVAAGWSAAALFTSSGYREGALNGAFALDPADYVSYSFSAQPTATTFSVAGGNATSASGSTYVAYLFASCPGVSKVGSYTGNGSNQTINCGFAAGARFVMIKRTDSGGDWYVWDSARGIVSGNDPRLSLNNTNAEVTTDDSVDTDSSGFVVNQLSATNINVNAATYLYMAVA